MIKYVYFGLSHEYDKYLYKIDNTNILSSPRIYKCVAAFYRPIFRIYNSDKFSASKKKISSTFWTKRLLSKRIKSMLSNSDEIRFIFVGGEGAEFVKFGFNSYLKKLYSNCKTIFVLDGVVSSFYRRFNFFDIDLIKKSFDSVISYNPIEVQKYALILDRYKVPNFEYASTSDKDTSECDVFFVGYAKNRLSKLHQIYDLFISKGLKCDFYICGVSKGNVSSRNIHYNKKLQYKEVTKRIRHSRAILNLLDEGNSGLTLRDYECIGFNKVLITNQKAIEGTPFYNKEMVVYLENFEKEFYKISKQAGESWNKREEFSIDEYYEWLEGELR